MNRETVPLVSVVVPTYDRGDLLMRAVESVLNQSYGYTELIVVDDCSPKPAADTLEGVPLEDLRNHEIIRHDENRGGSAARNTGIEEASGDYVAFLDDDDEWLPEKLEKQVARIEEAGAGVGVAYTGIRNVDADGRTNAVKTPGIEGHVTKQLLCNNFIGSFSALMVDVEVIEETGGLDERFPSWQDWDYYVRLSRYTEFLSVAEPLVVRHNHPEGQLSDSFLEKRDVTYPLFVEKFEPLALEQGSVFRRKMRGYLAYEIAQSALLNGRHDEAMEFLSESIRWYPLNLKAYLYWVLSLGNGAVYGAAKKVKRTFVRRLE